MPTTAETRPAVSVVVPFRGSADEASSVAERLMTLRFRGDDEIVIVDNTSSAAVGTVAPDRISVVRAPDQRSSYYARNVGARATSNPWILFIDADCEPPSGLLDTYFDREIAANCGAVVGAVVGAANQPGRLPAYARELRHLHQADYLSHRYRPFGATANLLVRRKAWSELSGFAEGIRSGGDIDFCWRLQDAGWKLAYAAEAVVEHWHRETVRGLVRQWMGYGAAGSWLDRHYPGSFESPWPGWLCPIPRQVAAALFSMLRGRPDRASRSALDAVVNASYSIGWFRGNRAPGP